MIEAGHRNLIVGQGKVTTKMLIEGRVTKMKTADADATNKLI
jgi:hypothetical protein